MPAQHVGCQGWQCVPDGGRAAVRGDLALTPPQVYWLDTLTSSISTNTRASLSSIRSWIFWNILVTSLPLWNQHTLSVLPRTHHTAWGTHASTVPAWHCSDPKWPHKLGLLMALEELRVLEARPAGEEVHPKPRLPVSCARKRRLESTRLPSRATQRTCLPASYCPFPSSPYTSHEWVMAANM